MRRRVASCNRLGFVAAVHCLLVFGTTAVAQESLAMEDEPRSAEPLVVREVLRLGTLDGRDAFGGISHVALRRDGGVLVADSRNRQVSLYDAHGRLTRRVGRHGRGPGEFGLPWHLSVVGGDSVLVWDLALGRMSVLTPSLEFARSFPLPQAWNISSLHELPSGELLVAAFDLRTRSALHIVSRAGNLLRSFAPVEIPPRVVRFHQSVLGGSAIVVDSLIVVSQKSPYRIDVFDHRGAHLRSCRGSPESTTPPEDVIEASSNGARLHWNRYVHSTAVLPSPQPGVVLNVIVDGENGRTTLDAVDVRSCTLVRRAKLPIAIYLQDVLGDRLVGSTERDFPEVVVYALHFGESDGDGRSPRQGTVLFTGYQIAAPPELGGRRPPARCSAAHPRCLFPLRDSARAPSSSVPCPPGLSTQTPLVAGDLSMTVQARVVLGAMLLLIGRSHPP